MGAASDGIRGHQSAIRDEVTRLSCGASLARVRVRDRKTGPLPVRSLNYAGTLAWVRSFALTIRSPGFCAKPRAGVRPGCEGVVAERLCSVMGLYSTGAGRAASWEVGQRSPGRVFPVLATRLRAAPARQRPATGGPAGGRRESVRATARARKLPAEGIGRTRVVLSGRLAASARPQGTTCWAFTAVSAPDRDRQPA
jgi:hypothetical protein